MLALTLSTGLALAGGSASSVSAAAAQEPPAVPGELIVGFERGASQADQNAAVAGAGATRAAAFGQIRAVLVRVPPHLTTAATKRLLAHPRVRYVEPNHVVEVAAEPDDPSFSQLWGLHNTGQTGGTADADIDAPEAWEVTTGSSDVVVGVTDTGVDFSHPDLAAQQWVNAGENCGSTDPAAVCADRDDGVDDDGNGYVDDWRGWDWVNDDNNPFDDNRHGTHVAGTIGAVGSNGVGVTGVNWNVKVMALKFLDSAGSGTTADAVAATLYAADRGAHVSSNSWGGGPFDQSLVDAVEYGASKGMLFVAAAGNDGRNTDTSPTYPGSYASDAIVSVAATDHNDALAFFSNYGAKTVDLSAPGVNILSTTPGGAYEQLSGTSMATPHVAGVAALLFARYPGASLYAVKALLLRSVDPVSALAGRSTTGGRLNAATAVSCADAPSVWLGTPATNFVAGVGDALPITVLAGNCASPAGLSNVSVTVNGSSVPLTAGSVDSGLYTGTYAVGAEGALTVTATVSAGGATATHSVSGNAYFSYTCEEAPFSWVDATVVPALSGADGDDTFSTVSIGFPFQFFGQSYSTAYVASNGFLNLGSSAGATAFQNAAIPTATAPNGFVAPFWDDLWPGSAGSVHAGISGSSPNRVLHVEWFNVPHWGGSGTVTFEVSLYEANGNVRFQWLDGDFGDSRWNFGASATAGLERADALVGRQLSFNQPLLTSNRSVLCRYNTTPPPPPAPTVTTTSLPNGTVGAAYSQTLAATGGTPPYTWSLDSGSLPPGLSLSSAGELSGTPTTAGTSTFTAKVTDAASQSATQTLSVTVDPPPAPTITTTSLADGEVGVAYSQTLAASGGSPPYTWSLDSGSLPPGLSLSSGGELSGTPTTAGTSAFTAQVTDSLSQSDTQALSIAVSGLSEVAASPSSTVIQTGSLRSGAAANLAADDNSYYEVNSSSSGNRTTQWYGGFTGVTNSLTSLRVSYVGKNSRSCSQTISIYRFSTGKWVDLNTRTVGTTEVAVLDLLPSGTLANYVSGSSGDGEVRVRVRCRTSSGSFFTSGDLLQITYGRP